MMTPLASFDIVLTSRFSRPIESLVAEMYLGEGAGGIKCIATRGSGGRGIGADVSVSGAGGASWGFDSRKMVPSFIEREAR